MQMDSMDKVTDIYYCDSRVLQSESKHMHHDVEAFCHSAGQWSVNCLLDNIYLFYRPMLNF